MQLVRPISSTIRYYNFIRISLYESNKICFPKNSNSNVCECMLLYFTQWVAMNPNRASPCSPRPQPIRHSLRPRPLQRTVAGYSNGSSRTCIIHINLFCPFNHRLAAIKSNFLLCFYFWMSKLLFAKMVHEQNHFQQLLRTLLFSAVRLDQTGPYLTLLSGNELIIISTIKQIREAELG